MHAAALQTLSTWASPDRESSRVAMPEMWRALYYFNFYRLVLAAVLITLVFASPESSQYGDRSPLVFALTAFGFGVVGIVNLITINIGAPRFGVQALFQIAADMILISLLMYASNGVSSGVGLLMVISIAGAGVVMSSRATMFFAAVASLLILGQSSFDILFDGANRPNYLQVGLLGAGILMTGFMVSVLASRIRESEEAAASARRALQRQQRVNAHVVQHLNSGVIAVDENNTILLSNPESDRLLSAGGQPGDIAGGALDASLVSVIDAWRQGTAIDTHPVKIGPAGISVMPRVVPVQETDQSLLMVYLDDQQRLNEQAQQEKLASLGRLTAAIAHEIRNPLSALNHAGQLLAESDGISTDDQRLLDIISHQTDRINAIIESVLQLGRKQRPLMQEIVLSDWLPSVIKDVLMQHRLDDSAIVFHATQHHVRGNSEQLAQVLVNLINNALQHSPSFAGQPLVWIDTVVDDTGDSVYIDVRDSGAGIDSTIAANLFEPFFTTDTRGTGLGLYISRELCAANGVRLDYISDDQPGSCFRLSFVNPPSQS